MKKLFITIFILLLFLPPVLWMGLFLTDKDKYEALEYDLGEKREKTRIESVSDLALSGEIITDYFADRAPFRSTVITFKRSADSAIEKPYEQDIRPAALKVIYGIEDPRKQLTVDVIARIGQKTMVSSEKIRAMLAEEAAESALEDAPAENEPEEEPAEEPEEFVETEHEWLVNNVIEPTYISYGYTEYVCKYCGETMIDDWTDKLVDTSYLAPNVHGDTTIGRFDWLFLYGWGNIPYYQANNILSEADMAVYVDRLNTLQALCDARGVKFAVIWAPSKDTIYPEYMPDFEVYDTYKRVPRLYDYIRANSSVKIAFPKEKLKDITRYYDSYYKYDSHWNFVGSFIGTQTLYSLIDMPQTNIMSLNVTKESQIANGDLIMLGGLNAADYPPFYEYTVHYKDWVSTTYETPENVLLNDSIYKTEAETGNNVRFVMVGDSYRNFMIPYIKKDFDHCTFIHREHVREATEDILNANILVLQSAERYDYKCLADMEYLIQLLSQNTQ